jgi:hypothetical protein
MSAPDQVATEIVTTPAAPTGWSEADSQALLAAAWWFDMMAPPELKRPYSGMHVAIYGEQIVDADRDKEALFRRLDADPIKFPPNRVLPRYVPTEEECMQFRY